MTTDDLPFDAPDSQPNLGAAPARRHRHDWVMAFTVTYAADGSETRADWLACRKCNAVRNEDAARRGKNNRARGKRVERVEMRKAGQHTGNANGADDGLSDDGMFAYQSKALASARFPSWMTAELDKLRAARASRVPVLMVAETAGQGRKGRRIAVVEWSDWLDLHKGEKP